METNQYLEEIRISTDNIEYYNQNMYGDLVALRYELANYQAEDRSGDLIIQEQLNSINIDTAVTNFILASLLLFIFIMRVLK